MKYRVGFVTNSSSSSYVCEVCGHDESGWDMCLSDAEMVQCVNGHTFCEDHMENLDSKEMVLRLLEGNIKKYKKLVDENPDRDYYKNYLNDYQNSYDTYSQEDADEDWDELKEKYEWRYELSEDLCPICSFGTLTNYQVAKYLEKKYGVNLDDLRNELKENFSSYNDFKKFIE